MMVITVITDIISFQNIEEITEKIVELKFALFHYKMQIFQLNFMQVM